MRPDGPAQLRRLLRVSPQRWLLAATAVIAAVGTSILVGVTGGGLPPLVLAIVGALAVTATARPDTHTALVVVGVVVWQWLVVTDDPTGPVVVATALGLLVFHTTIALMAAAPVTATFGTDLLLRWLARAAVVGGATVATWALVLLMETRRADGNALLTFAGFVVALIFVVMLLARASASRSTR